MSTPERERLLCDVLSDASHAEFRRQLLEHSLAELRQRQRTRSQHRWLALAACLTVVLGLSALFKFAPSPSDSRSPSFVTWRTQPLAPGQRLITRGATVTTLRTSSATLVLLFSHSELSIVQTDPRRYSFQRLTDGELLGLFAGHPMALVATGPQSSRLLFLAADAGSEFLGDPALYPY